MKFRFLITLTLSVLLLLSSCSKTEEVEEGGSIVYNGTTSLINSTRVMTMEYDEASKKYLLDLLMYPRTFTLNGTEISGFGRRISLALQLSQPDLYDGDYDISYSSESVFNDKFSELVVVDRVSNVATHDTIVSGKMTVEPYEIGKIITINATTKLGNTIEAVYKGKYTYNRVVDGSNVGYLNIGENNLFLQQAEMIRWNTLFSTDLYYYEFYFYSTNLRWTDNKQIYEGLVFVVGMHSSNAEFPTLGEYKISRNVENQTVFYGHKINSQPWGTFWNKYKQSESTESANVSDGSIVLSKEDDKYKVTFNLLDQLKNKIEGEYVSHFTEKKN